MDNLQAESDSTPAKSAKLSKGRDAKESVSEGKPLTEKQRQKQQSQFAQQMQNEFFEYLQHKDALVTGPPPSTARLKSGGREQKGKSSSPPHFQKTPGGKSYTATSKLSTSGAKNQVQILVGGALLACGAVICLPSSDPASFSSISFISVHFPLSNSSHTNLLSLCKILCISSMSVFFQTHSLTHSCCTTPWYGWGQIFMLVCTLTEVSVYDALTVTVT